MNKEDVYHYVGIKKKSRHKGLLNINKESDSYFLLLEVPIKTE